MPKIDGAGYPLAYDDSGSTHADRFPLVLIHAGIADRRMWDPLSALLAPHHRVIAYDLRGYGESTPASPAFAHHDDVVGLLDGLGIDRAVLVGCSFGGAVALDATLARPDRVAGLALLGSAVSGYEFSELSEAWDTLIGDIDEDDVDAVAAAEVRVWVVGPDRRPEDVDAGLIASAEKMNRAALRSEIVLDELDVHDLEPPALGRLGEVAVPTLVMAGAADLPEIRRLADRLAAEIPGARRLPDVPQAGHLLPLERPEPVAAALREFLAEIDAGAAR